MKSNHNRFQDESNNQFMAGQSHASSQNSQLYSPVNHMAPKNPQQMQKFMGMFQQMMTDPSSFMKLMMQSQASPYSPMPTQNSQYIQNQNYAEGNRKRQYQIEQHKYRNHEVSPRKSLQTDNPKHFPKNSISDSQNILNGYIPQKQPSRGLHQNDRSDIENRNYLQMAQSTMSVHNGQQNFSRYVNPYDQKPIQSKYAQEMKQSVSPRVNTKIINEKNAFDEQPIRPAEGFKYNINQSYQDNSQSIVDKIDPSKYIQAEQRPIKGIQGGDFKEYLKQQQGINFDDGVEQEQENQNINDNKKTKPFLKRGSRQYLSSAKNRPKSQKKPIKKQDTEMNSSRLRQTDKTRSVSQNRVLGARKNRNDKSASKIQTKNINKEQSLSDQSVKKAMQNKTTRNTYQREQTQSPTFRQVKNVSPKVPKVEKININKKKSKNIFKGSSSDESQAKSEKQLSIQRNNMGDNSANSYLKKIEVIKGVLLTKKQLHEILSKYGKQAQKCSNQEQKIKELKNKYLDLCNLMAQQKAIFEQQMQKQREEFQIQKQTELQKIKNQRKVQQRNLMATRKQKQRQKERQQLDILRKQLQKQRQEYKKKDKNNRIIIQKYKKDVEELKLKLSTLQGIQNRQSYSVSISDNKSETKKDKKAPKLPPKSEKKQKKMAKSEVQYNQDISDEGEYNTYNQQKSQAFSSQQSNSTFPKQSKLPNYQDIKNEQQGQDQYNFNKQTKKTHSKWANNSQSENQQASDKYDDEQIVQYNSSMKLQDLAKIPLSIKMVTDSMIQNLFRYDRNPQYNEYKKMNQRNRTKIHTSRNAAQRKLTNIYADGGKEVIFETGVKKQYFSNGYSIVLFTNGDIKQKLSDGTQIYYYNQKQVDQITLANGINIYRFDNNQIQFHFPDKSVQIRHPDGTFKVL